MYGPSLSGASILVIDDEPDIYGLVIGEVRKRGLPVASALGGGYGADPLEVAGRHARSMLACARTNARYADRSASGKTYAIG